MSKAPKAGATFANRVAAKKQSQLDAIKGRGRPLGGAPPIPEGKLSGLVEPRQDVPFELPPDVHQPVQGVGGAYEVNQAVTDGRPMTVGQAKRAGMGLIPDEEPEQEAPEEEEPLVDDKLDETERQMVDEFRDYTSAFNFPMLTETQKKLLSKERREAIEGRLDDLDLTDLVTTGEIKQRIPIVPGKLEILVRTYSQKEYTWMLENLYKYYSGTQEYVNEMLNTFKLVCSLVAVNGKRIPDHRDQDTGKVDKDRFEKKMDIVAGFPTQLISDISVQCSWFNERVLGLFDQDQIKNG